MEHTIENIEKRLDAHGNQIDGIEKCLERLTALSERMDREEQDHEDRLRALEHHGNDLWDKVVQTGISAIVAGVIAFMLVNMGIGA